MAHAAHHPGICICALVKPNLSWAVKGRRVGTQRALLAIGGRRLASAGGALPNTLSFFKNPGVKINMPMGKCQPNMPQNCPALLEDSTYTGVPTLPLPSPQRVLHHCDIHGLNDAAHEQTGVLNGQTCISAYGHVSLVQLIANYQAHSWCLMSGCPASKRQLGSEGSWRTSTLDAKSQTHYTNPRALTQSDEEVTKLPSPSQRTEGNLH